jgi:hypothetical protein
VTKGMQTNRSLPNLARRCLRNKFCHPQRSSPAAFRRPSGCRRWRRRAASSGHDGSNRLPAGPFLLRRALPT